MLERHYNIGHMTYVTDLADKYRLTVEFDKIFC